MLPRSKRGQVNCVCRSRRPSVRREGETALDWKALLVDGIIVLEGANDIA